MFSSRAPKSTSMNLWFSLKCVVLGLAPDPRSRITGPSFPSLSHFLSVGLNEPVFTLSE